MASDGKMRLISLFSVSDEQAMWRVQMEDDERAFAVLVSRWQEPIRRLCTRMVGDMHRAEDLAQETFLRLFDKRKRYYPGAKFSTYLWRIALNLCYDELRRRSRRPETSLDAESEEGRGRLELADADAGTPERTFARREEGELVRQALMQLPEIYRTVIVLRHYEDLKLREIAEILEIPEGTVNSRMAEGLVRLSRMLEPEFAPVPQPRRNPAKPKELLTL